MTHPDATECPAVRTREALAHTQERPRLGLVASCAVSAAMPTLAKWQPHIERPGHTERRAQPATRSAAPD